MIDLTSIPFDPAEELSKFTRHAGGAGGIVSFTGMVRKESANGSVKALRLQSYSPMTERGIIGAVENANKRWPLIASRIIHRVGEIAVDEAIVFVATASQHRRDAFEAADYLMDYLKTKAVFWKKEITAKSEIWIEPRSQDYFDAQRWQQTESERP